MCDEKLDAIMPHKCGIICSHHFIRLNSGLDLEDEQYVNFEEYDFFN